MNLFLSFLFNVHLSGSKEVAVWLHIYKYLVKQFIWMASCQLMWPWKGQNTRPRTKSSSVRGFSFSISDKGKSMLTNYSQLPITQTLKGNWKRFKLSGVRSWATTLNEVTGTEVKCTLNQPETWTGLTHFVYCKKGQRLQGWLKRNLMFWTSTLFVLICHVMTDVVQVIEGKNISRITWRETKIGSSLIAGGSSYWG